MQDTHSSHHHNKGTSPSPPQPLTTNTLHLPSTAPPPHTTTHAAEVNNDQHAHVHDVPLFRDTSFRSSVGKRNEQSTDTPLTNTHALTPLPPSPYKLSSSSTLSAHPSFILPIAPSSPPPSFTLPRLPLTQCPAQHGITRTECFLFSRLDGFCLFPLLVGDGGQFLSVTQPFIFCLVCVCIFSWD